MQFVLLSSELLLCELWLQPISIPWLHDTYLSIRHLIQWINKLLYLSKFYSNGHTVHIPLHKSGLPNHLIPVMFIAWTFLSFSWALNFVKQVKSRLTSTKTWRLVFLLKSSSLFSCCSAVNQGPVDSIFPDRVVFLNISRTCPKRCFRFAFALSDWGKLQNLLG